MTDSLDFMYVSLVSVNLHEWSHKHSEIAIYWSGASSLLIDTNAEAIFEYKVLADMIGNSFMGHFNQKRRQITRNMKQIIRDWFKKIAGIYVFGNFSSW
jgi:hypothetical protein